MASHKLSETTLTVQTIAAPLRSVELVRAVAPMTRGKPSFDALEATGITVLGIQLPRILLSVQVLRTRHILLTFTATVTAETYGSQIQASIDEYRMSQVSYGFVPLAPKSLVGYGTYKQFLTELASAVMAEEPSARCYLTEKGQQQLLERTPLQQRVNQAHPADRVAAPQQYPGATQAPAAWYPDPYGAPIQRYWDGTNWTEHTHAGHQLR